MKKHLLSVLIVAILVACGSGCGSDKSTNLDDQPTIGRGDIIATTYINSYSPSAIEQAAADLGLTLPFSPSLWVDAHLVHYLTIDSIGNIAEGSGALLFPETDEEMPLIGINRTLSTDEPPPSANPAAGVAGLMGLMAASSGQIVFLPDYLGFGKSDIHHPYYHAISAAAVVVDLARAAITYCDQNGISRSNDLMLTGLGEGAYMALAAQKEIERDHTATFTTLAVAPVGGIYDLTAAVEGMVGDLSYTFPINTASIITSHNDIYNWNRMSDIFVPDYANELSTLFDGDLSYSEIVALMPDTNAALLKPSFITDYLAGDETELSISLANNSLISWAPQAPIRFYHGDQDQKNPIQNTSAAIDSLIANGSQNVNLITVAGGNDATTIETVIWEILDWFLN